MEISLGMCVFWGFEGQDVMIFNACMHACMHACMQACILKLWRGRMLRFHRKSMHSGALGGQTVELS